MTLYFPGVLKTILMKVLRIRNIRITAAGHLAKRYEVETLMFGSHYFDLECGEDRVCFRMLFALAVDECKSQLKYVVDLMTTSGWDVEVSAGEGAWSGLFASMSLPTGYIHDTGIYPKLAQMISGSAGLLIETAGLRGFRTV